MTAPLTYDQAIAKLGEEQARTAARHALWKSGDLRYLLHDGRSPADPLVQRYVPGGISARRGQIAMMELVERCEATGDTPVFKCGRQIGKSRYFVVDASQFCVRRCLANIAAGKRVLEPARIPYAAPTHKQVEDFIMPHFQLMHDHAPSELRPEFFKGDWVFPDESRVVIRGCEERRNADNLRGPRAHRCYIDEAGFISILEYVMGSVLGWQLATTGGIMLVSSSPPESPDHPFVGVWERAVERGCAFESTSPEAPHMTRALIERAIERCGGEESIAWKREGRAMLIVDPERTVLPEFTEHEAMVVREVERPAYFLPHAIGDAGFEDMDVVPLGYYDFARDLDVIEDEVVLKHARSDTLDAAIAAKEKQLWGSAKVHRRRIDAPPKVRADMSREEWQAEDPDDAVRKWGAVSRDGGRAKGRLRAAANAARVRLVRGRIAIHPRCKTIIAHAKHARWNDARDNFERVYDEHGRPAHHYDGCAGLLYFLRDLNRASNPFPKLPPGISDATHYIDPSMRPEHKHTKLRKIFGR